MQIHITMDKDSNRPELRANDISETLPAGKTAEDRIRGYIAQHAARIDASKNPLDYIAVQIVEDSGTRWDWKGWGHEKVMRWGHKLDGLSPIDLSSGAFPNHAPE